MPAALSWTPGQDATIRRMRGERATWDKIAAELRVSRWTLIARGQLIGARLPAPIVVPIEDPERDPLPPGHPETWGAIIKGTCLAGTAYPTK